MEFVRGFFTSRVSDQRLVNRPFLTYYDDDRQLQCTYSYAEFATEGVHNSLRRVDTSIRMSIGLRAEQATRSKSSVSTVIARRARS